MLSHRSVVQLVFLSNIAMLGLQGCACGDGDDNLDAGPTDGGPIGDGGVADAGDGDAGDDDSGTLCCTLDARDVYFPSSSVIVETIFAHGKFYRATYESNVETRDADYGKDLTTIAHFVDNSGPCAGLAAGTCVIDAYSNHFNLSSQRVETIIAYGRYWSFTYDLSNPTAPPTPGAENGGELTSVERWMTGPCVGKTGADCRFDTISKYLIGNVITESITSAGKFWNFTRDISNGSNPWNTLAGSGNTLASVKLYQGGPCSGTTDANCSFTSRAVFNNGNAGLTESITITGRYYNYYLVDTTHYAVTAAPSNGNTLATVSKYMSTVCADTSDTVCPAHTDVCPQGAANCQSGCCAVAEACVNAATCCVTGKVCGNQCCTDAQNCNTSNYTCQTSPGDGGVPDGGGCTPTCAGKLCGADDGCGTPCLGTHRSQHGGTTTGVNSGCGIDFGSGGEWTCRDTFGNGECRYSCNDANGGDPGACCIGNVFMTAAQSMDPDLTGDMRAYCESSCNALGCGDCSQCNP